MTTSTATPSKLRLWGAFVCMGVVLIVAAGLLLQRLGAEPLQDYDEATYAEVTTESLASHEYLTFTYNHQNYFDKPPLLFWLMDSSKSILGETELGNRVPSALSGLLLVAAVVAGTFFVTRNGYIAALAGGILTTTSAFIEPARQVRFDILVSLFITLSVFAFLRALEDRRWFIWYGVFIGLTILSKGPLVLFALVPSLVIAMVYSSWRWLRSGYFWVSVGIACLIALPWHIYETVLFGHEFWDVYFFGQVVSRVQQVLFTLQPTNAEYVRYFFEFTMPWGFVFCAAVLATPFVWKCMNKRQRAMLAASLVGVAIVTFVCFITQTKAFSYLIPLYSFMAIACALVVAEVGRFWRLEFKALLVIVLCGLLASGLYNSVFNGFHENPYFAAEVSLAKQEKAIGQLIGAAHVQNFYVENVTTVGSIIYYGGDSVAIPIGPTVVIPVHSYVVYQTQEASAFQKEFPRAQIVYRGDSLSVARSD